jgi:hypothetical protein
VARYINKNVGGADTDSRDYKGGVFIGALVLAGVNITADLVQVIRASFNAGGGVIKEGTYEFADALNSGKTYVGQSGDIDRRLAEHIRDGRLASSDLANVRRTAVPGGKLQREIAEQLRITELGGIKGALTIANSQVDDLRGLSSLTRLEHLALYNLRKLKSLTASRP